ncbi:PAS domain-containing protein [Mucilaginibacter myungsuensis]|uniref:histidine kinase n=1 Tax=Mucilaginibacter myungsuensis TaxID=649104 RepID=A0A929L4Q5_9SPHI|nr:PAS domain-containing protein [Mucilaginibacter myungsuensis]MBE9663196.1 PAS domain-containing protein [Mucilaginibacter myungsuensis]MDN3598831.1 PAS domain-containing protein [Mucilaginibacter myungsuensis]
MASTYSFLEGGEGLGELIRNTEWSRTSFGSPDTWPDSLTSAVSIVLNSGFPIAIYWGADFSLIYNAPWSEIPGEKHPWALGRPGQEVWPEIWDGLKEEFESVLYKGRSYRRPDAPLYMHRFGYTEECYFDYTLSPIKDRDGSVGGVFNAVIETTFKVINARRNKLIAQLMNNKYASQDVEEALNLIKEILENADADIPFFALYGSKDEEPLHLIISSGLSPLNIHQLAAHLLENPSDANFDLHDARSILAEPVNNHWPEAVTEILFVPIAKGKARFKGHLLCGVSARKRMDEDYRNFLQTVGMHIGTILNNALAYELSEAYHNEQALNEELAAANEELAAINEELLITQEHLNKLNEELEERVERRTEDLAAERDKLKRFFMQAPAGICVLTGPELIFELVNGPFQELLPERVLLGRPIFEALPEIKEQPIGDILRNVYRTGEPYEGKELYIPTTTPESQELTDRYFNFYYEPRRDETGEVEGIMAFVYEVTELVEARKRSQRTERDLRNLVMTSHYPLMILRGSDYMIEVANDQLAALWDRSLEDILGRRLLELLPELVDQPFPALLKGVYVTGKPYGQEEEVFHLDTDEGRVTKYVSFYYDPLKDENGAVAGIIVAAADITDTVRSRQLLEESYEEQQSLNEEIIATNEELAAANEELVTANEELSQIQNDLARSLSELRQSEARFRSLIQDAPVAIALLRTRELIIEAANTAILSLWGKQADIIGGSLEEGLPELKGQAYLKILDEVYTSGIAYKGAEARVLLEHKEGFEEFFVNFVYQPLFDEQGLTNAIMVVAIDVTPQVISRKELEKTKDSLKLAFDAAELGNFDLDLIKGTMHWDKRCRTLFGISHDHEVTYEKDFVGGLHPDDKDRIVDVISNHVLIRSVSNGDYDVEYRTVGMDDQKLRWIRAKGKAYFNEADQPVRFVGAVLDITEQKLDEIRKNDFIGMASHELKTPLTSLSAYMQVLLSKAKKQEDQFSVDALSKVNQQVRKMSAMINGFLNISRLESGKIHLDKQPFMIHELLESIADETRLIVNSHDIRLQPGSHVTVNADRDKVGSVITNLVSNAVKYSPKGTVINLTCTLENSLVKVTVTDEGLGIRPEDQSRLFERYYRVEDQQAKYVSGFGIGLYLSAEIIERHNGQIGVESEIGKGSTFWFTLPV